MADIRMSVVKFSTPTSTGTMDVTGSLGGATPKVAICYSTRHTASNDPGVTAGLFVGGGATDGTRQFCGAIVESDGDATSNTLRHAVATSFIKAINGAGANVIVGAFSAFGADKVTVNFTTVEASARQMIMILLAGDDLTAYVGTTTLASGSNTITAPNFQSDALLVFSFNSDFPGSAVDDAQIGYGCAINNGSLTQSSIVAFHNDNTANQDSYMLTDSNAIMTVISTTGTLAATHTLTAFSSTGFSISSSAATTGWGYIALKFGGGAFNLVNFLTPTGTGNSTISIPSVLPAGIILCLGTPDALDTLESDNADACGYGMGACTDSGESGSVSTKVTDDADPMDVDCDCKATPIRCGISGGSSQSIAASFVSVGSEALTLNYTATDGTARYGWAFAFGASTFAWKPSVFWL